MIRRVTSTLRASITTIACIAGTTGLLGQSAAAQSTIQGDINGDGSVGFDDLVLLLANWQGNTPQNLGWGVIAPSVRSVHQLQVESVEETACILVLDLDAEYVSQLINQPQKRRGIRALTRPGGWPAWPPPGSALEELMERMTTDPESVERLARQMLDALPPMPHEHEPPATTPEPGGPPENPGPTDDPNGVHPENPDPPIPEIPEPTDPPPDDPTPGHGPGDW